MVWDFVVLFPVLFWSCKSSCFLPRSTLISFTCFLLILTLCPCSCGWLICLFASSSWLLIDCWSVLYLGPHPQPLLLVWTKTPNRSRLELCGHWQHVLSSWEWESFGNVFRLQCYSEVFFSSGWNKQTGLRYQEKLNEEKLQNKTESEVRSFHRALEVALPLKPLVWAPLSSTEVIFLGLCPRWSIQSPYVVPAEHRTQYVSVFGETSPGAFICSTDSGHIYPPFYFEALVCTRFCQPSVWSADMVTQ